MCESLTLALVVEEELRALPGCQHYCLPSGQLNGVAVRLGVDGVPTPLDVSTSR